jgi:hypothetical protein
VEIWMRSSWPPLTTPTCWRTTSLRPPLAVEPVLIASLLALAITTVMVAGPWRPFSALTRRSLFLLVTSVWTRTNPSIEG